MRRIVVLGIVLMVCGWAMPVHAGVRIKDITDFEGARANQLYGFGLVVGLDGTGSRSLFTQQVAVDMLQKLNVGAKTFGDTTEGESDIYLGGTSNIMDQPDFASNLEQMKELFKAFEEKNRLIRILDKCLENTGVHVLIGSETPFKDIRECSFVTHTYSYDNRTLGVLGVVGPKRMVYPRIMAIVDHTASVVSKILTQG